jgi:hypothetical protein
VPAIRKDGARISVEFTIVPFADDSGRIIGIAAIMRDATARFQEMRQLRQALAAQKGTPSRPDDFRRIGLPVVRLCCAQAAETLRQGLGRR